jgi:CRISPR-associated protein Cas2
MPMTMLVTRDVPDRYAGFLASIMPEIGPGVFVSPNLSKGVRERIWTVLSDWWDGMPGGSITLVWRDDSAAGHLGLLTLGLPPRTLADVDGALLIKRGM